MKAFEISINNEFSCIAGIPGHHVLTAVVLSKSVQDKNQFLFNVQGNDFSIFSELNFSGEMSSQEKLNKIMEVFTKQGIRMKEWIKKDFNQEVEIEIRIVDVDPKQISPGKDINPDMKSLSEATTQFLGLNPS
ncbi:MAG: hypothetical protein AAF696_07850 [Bacteroidota bacterium]